MAATIQKLATAFPLPYEQLVDFCESWEVTELALFGSILRDDFGPESDIDFLVTFAPNSHRSLLDLVKMEQQLENLLCRKVDLITKKSIEQSHNWIRRQAILDTAQVIYAT
ncbi:nucleotidyltransferase [filamentous cyanobacterium CCP5]|nr:nucleotidyltransferase [filamentous cyanobacterium CCP5]